MHAVSYITDAYPYSWHHPPPNLSLPLPRLSNLGTITLSYVPLLSLID